jgi:hypothetical protein
MEYGGWKIAILDPPFSIIDEFFYSAINFTGGVNETFIFR